MIAIIGAIAFSVVIVLSILIIFGITDDVRKLLGKVNAALTKIQLLKE